MNRATSLSALGRHREALRDFERALVLDPRESRALFHRGELHETLGQLDLASADFARALELDPDSPDPCCALGRVRTIQGDLFGALDVLERGLEQNPEHGPLYKARGIVFSELGRHPEAIADQNEALELLEDEDGEGYQASILNSRAISLRQSGQIERALADFDRVLALEPQSSLYLFNRGLAHADLDFPSHDLEQARRDFERALELDPDYVDARLELGRLQLWCDEAETALQTFELALSSAPERADLHAARAEALEELGRRELSIQAYGEAIRLDPGEPLYFLSRGQAHEREGATELSIADLTHAIRLSEGTYASAFSSRGVAKYNVGDLQGALADYTRAIELEPDEPIYWRNRAEVLSDLGDEAKAEADEAQADALED